MSPAASKRWTYAGLSAAMVLPCFWQPRLHGSDLSSLMYNAWLAQSIESGRAAGMQVVNPATNVLFDLLLGWLYVFGAEWAQRIAVSLTVLTFVWGAWAFVRKVSAAQPWHLLPCLAMLAYGWVFHMGFFNFYLSMGLCFWAMAMVWTPSRGRLAAAAALLAGAYTAHALPVFWTGGLLSYLVVARHLTPRRRAALSTLFLAGMAAVHLTVKNFITEWTPPHSALSARADQIWVFDGKYYFVLAALLTVWTLLFLALVRCRGARDVVGSVPFQLCLVAAGSVMVLPELVLLPGFAHGLGYIAERMSLGVAVCVCAVLGAAPPRLVERWGLVAVAVVFFGFVYRDERALNALEDRREHVISMNHEGNGYARPGTDKITIKFQTIRPLYQ